MIKRIIGYFVVILISLIIIVKITKVYANENFLNHFAEYFFDKEYYVSQYPEILEQKNDPFDHYVTIGWKDGKNPSSEFNSIFYKNMYLQNNKYNLNPLAHYCSSLMSLKFRFTNPSQLKRVKTLESAKHYLALTAIFRDEAPYLKEWIEFYRAIGVEHFYLYNHLSKDNFEQVLKEYVDSGIVTLVNVMEEASDLYHWNEIQTSAYFSTIQKTKDSVEWLIIVDTDEFLFPLKEKSLAKALKEYDEYPGLSVNWRIFGSSGVKRVPENKLLIEELVMTSENKDFNIKTIIKPRYVERIHSPHFPVFKKGYEKVNEKFEYFSGPFIPSESRQVFRVNHYWSRDLDFFYSRKISRVHVISKELSKAQVEKSIQSMIEVDKRNSSIYDGDILKYVDELRARVFN